MESDHIDKLFSDYLSDFEEKAPEYLWHNIQADVSNQKRLRRNSRIRAIAASVALLITFGLGYLSSDIALKNKYEAKYLKLNTSQEYKRYPMRNASDSGIDFNEHFASKKIIPKKNITYQNVDESKNQPTENKSYLYKIFYISRKQFLSDSTKKVRLNQLTLSGQNSNKKNSNQLLIDTLLLEEGNLPEGGFLLSKRNEKVSRWSFGTKFSPVYSMADNSGEMALVDNQNFKSSVNNDKPNTRAEEKSLLAFSGGLNVNYQFAHRWSVESGLFYSQRRRMAGNLVGSSINGFEDEMVIYTPEGIKQLEPQGYTPNLESSQVLGYSRDETYYSSNMDYISNYEYLELPIIVRYKIVDKKLGFDILSGISTDFLIGNRSSIIQDDISLWTGQTQQLSPLLYNATLGFGMNYNFYQSFSFNLEPTFKYSLIQSESTSMLKYPYSFAIFAGFSYRFK